MINKHSSTVKDFQEGLKTTKKHVNLDRILSNSPIQLEKNVLVYNSSIPKMFLYFFKF